MADEKPAPLSQEERQSLVEIYADAMDLHVSRRTEREAKERQEAEKVEKESKDAKKPQPSLAERFLGLGLRRR